MGRLSIRPKSVLEAGDITSLGRCNQSVEKKS